jgi:preprotein translocase subunit YajC
VTTLILGQANTAAPAKDAKAETAKDGGSPPPADSLANYTQFILIGLIIVIFIFFMRRSQKRQADEQQKMIDSLKQGQKVMLTSGMFGRISKVNKEDREVVLVVDENRKVELTFNVLAVAKLVDEETKSVEPEKK